MSRPQDIGNEFEKDFANKIGGSIQPGSGNQWFAKLDVRGKRFLWSLKATKHASFRVTTYMLKEAINAVEGLGGVGNDTTPGMGVRVAGQDFVILRLEDFIHLVKDDVKLIAATKKDERFARANTPKLLRPMKEDEDG